MTRNELKYKMSRWLSLQVEGDELMPFTDLYQVAASHGAQAYMRFCDQFAHDMAELADRHD